MNYVQARSIFFTERAREVLAFMKSEPEAHHIVIMPAFSQHDSVKDVFDRQRCFKERVPYCSPTADLCLRQAYMEKLGRWVATPHEYGYSLLSSHWAYGGWRVKPHQSTKIFLSWVSTVTPDIQDAFVEQALGRYIGFDNLVGLDSLPVKVGCLPKRKPFGLVTKEEIR